MTISRLRAVFDRTEGHCHFCGDALVFENRGWSGTPEGHWEVDHVIQRAKGGKRGDENCLPACTRCNRLRWNRTGPAFHEVIFYGLVAAREVRRRSLLGRAIGDLAAKQLAKNRSRRRG
jgi:5-methylcytosine-specific restriction endonuclease McrA